MNVTRAFRPIEHVEGELVTKSEGAQLSVGSEPAGGTVAGVDLKAIRARCGKGHVSLRHLAQRAAYCIDPMSDNGVAAAQSLADIPALIDEVERLRRAVGEVSND